ncbi:redoxin domain-containing protein [Rhodopirellula sp. JC639]|uniref:redoxin domain-containing protein n=1 Tax=Stieleria mannarensis TaxID=2755585 RepID=UPI0015FF7529|nr:redoxin domain-containing protein [Rhodopirellula sp. JC639]
MKRPTAPIRRFVFTPTTLIAAALTMQAIGVPIHSTVLGADPGKPIAVGDKAPDFELPIQGRNDYVTLSQLNADGPVVVVVLRGFPGYQCPICNRQVGAMANRAKTLSSALGDRPGRVVLVYPGEDSDADLERRAKQFLGARRLPESLVLVRDPGMEMITSWGLRWDARRETAYPAAYVIGVGRRVAWSKVSDSHGGRASVEEILRALKNL